MNANVDLGVWRQQWKSRSEPSDVRDPRGWVDRETRRMRVAMIGPVLVTIVAGGGTLLAALSSRRMSDIVLAVGVWCFILTCWSCGLWIARNTWRPLAETTNCYVQASIARCRSALSSMRFAAILYCVGLVGVVLWKSHYHSSSLYLVLQAWPTVVFATVITPVFFLSLSYFARKRRKELTSLLEIERQIVEDPTLLYERRDHDGQRWPGWFQPASEALQRLR
jgi:hypothetical protein